VRRDRVTVTAQGRRYRLGRTDSYGAIWKKRSWGWQLVARYPLTDEGWGIAAGQFALWEPDASLAEAWGAGASSRRRRSWTFWAVPAVVVVLLMATGVALYVGHDAPFSSSSASHVTAAPRSKSASPTTTTKPGPKPVGTGYLAKGSTTVVFIQWTDENNHLKGTAQETSITGTAPTQHLSTSTISVTGQINGTLITLSFNGNNEEFGTISGNSFTVNFPQSNGTLAPVTFKTATASQYNGVVAVLRSEISSANSNARAQEQKAATETTIDQDAKSVISDIDSLETTETSLDKAVVSVNTSLSQEGTQLATTQSALNSETSCFTAGRVELTASRVELTASRVGSSADDVKSDITSIRSQIGTLKTAAATLAAAESNFGGYVPPDQPAATAVTQAVAAANAAITAAISTTNGYIAQANADASTAGGVAAQAQEKEGCGSSSITSFTPVPSIT